MTTTTTIKTYWENKALELDPKNAEYIITNPFFLDHLNFLQWKAERHNEVDEQDEKMLDLINTFDEKFMTPANVEVGDGVTMHLYTDSKAATIIKKTKTSITIQLDKATLSPEFKPEFVVGGFAGHCTNQDEQTYTYEQDPEGDTVTYRWSKKFGKYRNNYSHLYAGRRTFKDYNF